MGRFISADAGWFKPIDAVRVKDDGGSKKAGTRLSVGPGRGRFLKIFERMPRRRTYLFL
jgi:hypothetical protein